MHESFLVYRRFLYLKLSLGLVFASILAYALHDPAQGPNGGTWLGYTLGTIGAVLILWFLCYGLRVRQYHSHLGEVRGWLSGHVYLGLALVVVATLHCGFKFGWNVHTLTYVLMMLVIMSGAYGVYTYIAYPTRVTKNKGNMTIDGRIAEFPYHRWSQATLSEIAELDNECLEIADKMGPEVHQKILRSIDRTKLDRSIWRAVAGRLAKVLENLEGELVSLAGLSPISQVAADGSTILFLVPPATTLNPVRAAMGRRLLNLVTEKKTLVARLQRDLRYRILMKWWLALHIPLSITLLAALSIHVITVFFYW